jgi:hypothetical protein
MFKYERNFNFMSVPEDMMVYGSFSALEPNEKKNERAL